MALRPHLRSREARGSHGSRGVVIVQPHESEVDDDRLLLRRDHHIPGRDVPVGHRASGGDGTAGVHEILEHVETETDLDVIAITDHDRIDAAVAARSIAADRGMRVEIGDDVIDGTVAGRLDDARRRLVG